MNEAVNPIGGSGTNEGRDGACTPKWLADLLPVYDLDPCSNNRSHIKSQVRITLKNGNGLMESKVGRWCHYIYSFNCETGAPIDQVANEQVKTFINPPYARGQVERWVGHYKHTNFTFLLRWDPSTWWFAELWPECWGAWFPAERMNFEPPPGVKFSSNPFPHALYFKQKPDSITFDKLLERGYFVQRCVN